MITKRGLFAGNEYKSRHEAIREILHQELAIPLKMLQSERIPYYKYLPNVVLKHHHYRIYWDRTVLTNLTVAYNRLDIILVKKKEKKAILLDVAIPNNNNLRHKCAQKISKYQQAVENV